jgi:hypothetical protein
MFTLLPLQVLDCWLRLLLQGDRTFRFPNWEQNRYFRYISNLQTHSDTDSQNSENFSADRVQPAGTTPHEMISAKASSTVADGAAVASAPVRKWLTCAEYDNHNSEPQWTALSQCGEIGWAGSGPLANKIIRVCTSNVTV